MTSLKYVNAINTQNPLVISDLTPNLLEIIFLIYVYINNLFELFTNFCDIHLFVNTLIANKYTIDIVSCGILLHLA